MFQPGQSGNPGGRPKGITAYVQKLAGAKGQKLIAILWTIANDPEEESRDRIKAVSVLLDRGWNKPVQGIQFTDTMRPVIVDTVTDADLQQRRAEAEE